MSISLLQSFGVAQHRCLLLQVVLSCLLVPLWLAVIRELLHGHGHRSAGMLAAGGLTWMVLAEGIHRTTHAARQKAARSAVTAANARQSHTNSGELKVVQLACVETCCMLAGY